ncbi:MAG: glycosyltransferase family 2 protein [Armatimonadetes bacterium]|nr:glycosyltransferase family 2 protein [Armatimonadota bacterium]
MPDLDLSIAICSWNTREDLQICLESLALERASCSFEVLVVDNNSEDGSPDMVAELFPWVRLFRMEHNLGFTGGNNYAMDQHEGQHFMLLNSDTIVHPGALSTLLAYLTSNPSVGIVGPKLLNPDGTLQFSCRKFPNPVAALFRNTPIGKLFPNNKFTRDYLMADWDHNLEREVDWVSGAALLIRKGCLDRVGKMDPEYFMFCEDVDWCWQAHQHGFKVMYYPKAVITHAIGRSTDKAPNRMIGRFHRSMFRFYQKNMVPRMNPLLRPFALLFAATMLGMRAGIFILHNRLDDYRRQRNRDAA